MKNKKNMCIGLCFLVVCFLSGCSIDPFLSDRSEYNEIDAVSSASADIQVTGGKAYSYHAILKTYHKDSYKHHVIRYGISAYTDSVIVADTPRIHLCTLYLPAPNTVYNFIFVGDYPPNAVNGETHSVKGTFVATIPAGSMCLSAKYSDCRGGFKAKKSNFILQRSLLTVSSLTGCVPFSGEFNREEKNSIMTPISCAISLWCELKSDFYRQKCFTAIKSDVFFDNY